MISTSEDVSKISFNTSYNQFYICDKESPLKTGDDFWNETAFRIRLAKDVGVLGVGTECYGPAKGEIAFLQQPPFANNLDRYDHVVEGDLMVTSKTLQLRDCPNGHVEFEKELKPGNYRVRVSSMNLASVEGDEGDDYYRIEIWEGEPEGEKLLKEYIRR
ncbi:hypothetical protein GU926_08910 [Nibribacter ruber]|uniref:Uncharacterized protein n=1 Tax=Nibribacter ruber TaxID=2698458 RepID=A0A6P1NZZ0_9BACT|nr:hypothetical protein [Nibribacter ruber]QHL87551.1 hypothetical protein GU926_08910 [Nibribacter ruber]